MMMVGAVCGNVARHHDQIKHPVGHMRTMLEHVTMLLIYK
jgi:hypothetical protein